MPPPPYAAVLPTIDPGLVVHALINASHDLGADSYDPWDKFRHKATPDGMTPEQSWALTKLARNAGARQIPPLLAQDGTSFKYTLPDELLRRNEYIARKLSASQLMNSPEIPSHLSSHVLVSANHEEAIRSSQLEGAVTSRREAKKLLAEKRQPQNISERMIVNNYRAILLARNFASSALTPEIVLALHEAVTKGTLESPEHEGQLQQSDAQRVKVWGEGDQLLFTPPPVDELQDRLVALCEFANGDSESYLPDTLKGIILHFMMGYNHFFEDGNGRTARTLFYWYMLRKGYWLTEYISISQFLKEAPALYARAYLHTEQDENDLTYFLLHQTRVIIQAIESWEAYLTRKSQSARATKKMFADQPELQNLNERQLWVVQQCTKSENLIVTAYSLAESFGVVPQTARLDLQELENLGLLEITKSGRKTAWTPSSKLVALLESR